RSLSRPSYPERPGLFRFDEAALFGGQVRVADKPRRQCAGTVRGRKNAGDRAHLRLVVWRTVVATDIAAPPGRPDLGEPDMCRIGHTEARFERPAARVGVTVRCVAQL